MASATLAPITVEDVKKTLTQDEQNEVDKPDFLEPLKLFLEGVNNIPNPTVENQTPYLERARSFAVQRTSVRNAIVKNPAILQTEINPVVIIGMARSGTTVLQRLLSSDTRFISPMFWELLKPCPPGRPENWKETDRYKSAAETLGKTVPGIMQYQHMHKMDFDIAEECMWLLQPYFLDMGTSHYRGMDKWKNFSFYPPEQNIMNAYEYYKKALQCIFHEGLNDGKIPLLKAPIHPFYLDTYRKVFPNVKFIFPYRNAKEMVGSGCSVFYMARQLTKIEITREEIKNYMLESYRLASSRAVENIKDMPKDSIFTVSYSELVKDPIQAMRELYSHFNWKMARETEEHLRNYIEKNPQHKHGKHNYTLEEFGITDKDLRENLPEFLEYFGANENLL